MKEEIRRELERFGLGPSLLRTALCQFPKKMWCYQPRADRWSIHDHVIHLAEAEAITYLNCRRCIAEPGTSVIDFGGQHAAWSFLCFNQNTREAFKIISNLRKSTYKLLVAVPDRLWENIVLHPREGSITLERWMIIQVRYIPRHIEQMWNNYNSWVKSNSVRNPGFPAPETSEDFSNSAELV